MALPCSGGQGPILWDQGQGWHQLSLLWTFPCTVSSPQPPMASWQAVVGWWDVLALQNSWIHQKALEDASAKPRGARVAWE